jgi:hypothetical protein
LGVYTNRIRWPRSDKNAHRLATDLSTPRAAFFPNGSAIPHVAATTRQPLCQEATEAAAPR